MTLSRDADVQIALRRHEMQLARALLGDHLLKPGRRVVRSEVLDPDLSVVRHLGLELHLAADDHGAHRDLEGLSAAADGLDDLHEALAQHSGADLLLQLRL